MTDEPWDIALCGVECNLVSSGDPMTFYNKHGADAHIGQGHWAALFWVAGGQYIRQSLSQGWKPDHRPVVAI